MEVGSAVGKDGSTDFAVAFDLKLAPNQTSVENKQDRVTKSTISDYSSRARSLKKHAEFEFSGWGGDVQVELAMEFAERGGKDVTNTTSRILSTSFKGWHTRFPPLSKAVLSLLKK